MSVIRPAIAELDRTVPHGQQSALILQRGRNGMRPSNNAAGGTRSVGSKPAGYRTADIFVIEYAAL
jgi:hypothetical protein